MAIFERNTDASSPTGWKLIKFREQVGDRHWDRHYRHIAEKTFLIVEDEEFNFVVSNLAKQYQGANPVDNANNTRTGGIKRHWGRHEVQTDFGPYLGTLEEKC
jgi:hypothetical protein